MNVSLQKEVQSKQDVILQKEKQVEQLQTFNSQLHKMYDDLKSQIERRQHIRGGVIERSGVNSAAAIVS